MLLMNIASVMRKITYKITLQNPKPSEETALKNLSFDLVDWSISYPTWTMGTVGRRTINFPRKTPSTTHDQKLGQ